MRDHVDATDPGLARGRDHAGREHADGRGLAGAVRAEQPEHLAPVHRRGRATPRRCTWPPRPSKTLVSATVRMTPFVAARCVGSVPAGCGGNRHALDPTAGGIRAQISTPGRARDRERLLLCTEVVLSILRPVSGGVTVTFYGVRGSTPCTGRRVRALRRPLVVRRARGATTSRRSSSISAPACARTG